MRFLGTLVVASFLAVAACDGTDPPVPTTIRITPASVTFQSLGESQQLSAEVLDATGNPIAGDFTFSWSTTNSGAVSVSASGLATAVRAGSASITAAAEGLSGSANATVDQLAADIQAASGDAQSGEAGEQLAQDLTVVVFDAGGSPATGQTVTFSVVEGGGSVTSATATTNTVGRASTRWTLGTIPGSAQRVRASVAGVQVDFTASAEEGLLAIRTTALPNARVSLGYSGALEAKGGDGIYTWSIVSGALPTGLTLQSDGTITGTPSQAQLSQSLQVQVADNSGATVTRTVSINVCEAPLQLALGQTATQTAGTDGGCGFFLPAGSSGSAYRVAMVRLTESESGTTVGTTLQMTTSGGVTADFGGPQVAAAAQVYEAASRMDLDPERFMADLALAQTTEAAHHRIREAEVGLVERMRTSAAANRAESPDLTGARSAFRVDPPATASFSVTGNFGSCASVPSQDATLLGFNDHLAIYQNTAQNSGADAVSADLAQQMLDYYDAYGVTTIAEYFDGVSDVNDDERITVLITPDISEGTAAFVWSGDFFPNTPGGAGLPGFQTCAASNAQEMIYFSAPLINNMEDGSSYQALATLVHEAKHVSSLHNRIVSSSSVPFHPGWVEEGTAEIAGELSSRKAWAATGGPAVGAQVRGQDFNGVTPENYGIFLRLARIVFYAAAQPNGVTASLTSQQGGIYGSGLLFHRFVGDAYGNAATPLADQSLFREQNDPGTIAGASAFPTLTGKTYLELLEEYAQAILLHGTGFEAARTFTTYDFSTATEIFSLPDPPGTWPWPDTRTCGGVDCPNDIDSRDNSQPDNDDRDVLMWAPFQDKTYSAPLGPGGIRVFEFQSNGTGDGAEVVVDGASNIRVFVARIR